MSWNTRKNGKRYYYQSFRDDNGDVKTRYIGTGKAAAALATEVSLSRERQKRRKDDLERVTKSYNELNIVVDPVIIHLELICLAVMTVSGYRRYPNGIWRKRRAMSDQCDQQIEIITIGDAIRAAELGDCRGLTAIRYYLKTNPTMYLSSGSPAVLAMQEWISLMSGDDILRREMLSMKVADLKTKLKADATEILDDLFVDRVVLSWLRLYYNERRMAVAEGTSDPDNKLMEHYSQSLLRAETSHRCALKDFAANQQRKPSMATIKSIAEVQSQTEQILQSTTENPFDPTKHIQDYLDMPD